MLNLKYNIILGSQSPRRKELLKMLDIPFTTVHLNAHEDYPIHLIKEEIAEYLAEKKSLLYSIKNNDLLITADTIVWIDNKVLNKPQNIEEAKEMLRLLSGKVHSVYTGVCIKTSYHTFIFSDESKVYFKNLTDKEINYYTEKYLPLDKAGAYGVQEWIGAIAIHKIEGSYFNVMGLPIHLVYQHLKILNNE
ncbi:MAG: Maf family nucleotide pyrophosphatase [Bacteroidia bacterium]|nr:Maf family nucleotide pyrophosphatase [Bacteroidia bacterium]